MRRAAIAAEFGIRDIHFIPVVGGVLEYGSPITAKDMAMEEIQKFVSTQVLSCLMASRHACSTATSHQRRTCTLSVPAWQASQNTFAYVIYWAAEADGLFRVVGEHVTEVGHSLAVMCTHCPRTCRQLALNHDARLARTGATTATPKAAR